MHTRRAAKEYAKDGTGGGQICRSGGIDCEGVEGHSRDREGTCQ